MGKRAEQIHKIDPEFEIQDLPLSHPIFHSYLDVEEVSRCRTFTTHSAA
jgi:hypothetical protein